MAEPIRIDFTRSLYEPEAIRETIAAWGGVASFTVEETDGEVTVVIADAPEQPADLADHFCNHVLFASVALQRRQRGAA